MVNFKGALRQIFFPYDVFQRDVNNEIKTEITLDEDGQAVEKPLTDPIATLSARIISVLLAITGLAVAIRELLEVIL